MKTLPRLICIFILTSMIYPMAFAGDLSKVEPLLRMKAVELGAQPGLKMSQAAGTVQGAPIPKGLVPKSVKPGEKVTEKPIDLTSTEMRNNKLYLDTFVTLRSGASTKALEALGVIIGSRSGDIVTADIAPELLEQANALPEVVQISGSWYGTPMNDAAVADTGVDEVWNTMGYQGNNVLVGVVDSGINWSHEDFKNTDGSSRILHVWDHTVEYAEGVGLPAPEGYTTGGTLWSKELIDNGQCTEKDDTSGGHGTHVTGSAAGDGSATGNGQTAGRFKGVANESSIMFAKTNWSEQSWADACQWMYTTAGEMGLPMSINLSLGSIGGPHDGSTAIEQYLSGLLGTPGRAMAISAANSGSQSIHAYSTLVQETGEGNSLDDFSIVGFWAYPIYDKEKFPYGISSSVGISTVELWYPAQSSMEWRVLWLDYNEEQQQYRWTVSEWVGSTSQRLNYQIQGGGLASVLVTIESVLPYNDGRDELNYGYAWVRVPEGGGPALNGWPFFIQMKGKGVPVHLWHIIRDQGSLMTTQYVNDAQAYLPEKLIEPDDSYTLGKPGSADKPVCVASYVSKNQWTNIDGDTVTRTGTTLGEISSFSSRGPRRDGTATVEQQKPDIAAPGEVLISALSTDLTLDLGQQYVKNMIERDGVHQKMQGTSMSSPVVTGLMALMLEKNPSLTSDQIKTILRNTAREAGDTGWDPKYGAGKIDAVAALNAVSAVQVTETPTSVGPTSTPTSVVATSTPTPTAVPPTSTPTGIVVPPTSTPTPVETGDQGDVNLDGTVDTRDAIRLLRHIEAIEALAGQGLINADANADTEVNQSDVDWILNRTVGN